MWTCDRLNDMLAVESAVDAGAHVASREEATSKHAGDRQDDPGLGGHARVSMQDTGKTIRVLVVTPG